MLAEQAAALRSEAPLDASAAYASLADLSTRVDERVGYLVEAAGLADLGGDAERASALMDEALVVAGSSPGISADVRVRKGLPPGRGEWVAAPRDGAAAALGLEGHPAETRARAVVVWQGRAALDLPPQADEGDPVAALVGSLAELPEAAADLYLAVAELRSGRGGDPQPWASWTRPAALDLPLRPGLAPAGEPGPGAGPGGRLEAAAALLCAAGRGSRPQHPPGGAGPAGAGRHSPTARRLDEAAALVLPLAETAGDAGVRGRALLLTGRLAEQGEDATAALAAYQQVLTLDGIDADTRDEARISPARNC